MRAPQTNSRTGGRTLFSTRRLGAAALAVSAAGVGAGVAPAVAAAQTRFYNGPVANQQRVYGPWLLSQINGDDGYSSWHFARTVAVIGQGCAQMDGRNTGFGSFTCVKSGTATQPAQPHSKESQRALCWNGQAQLASMMCYYDFS